MKITVWAIGKTNEAYLKTGIELYIKRLKRYIPFAYEILPDIRQAGKLSPQQLKEKEAELVLQRLKAGDCLVILDEKGKMLRSVAMADWVQQRLNQTSGRIIFLIGGAFGFHEKIYQRADYKLSFSAMTFSHQMIRLFLVEQIYRSFTILRNEPYHNE